MGLMINPVSRTRRVCDYTDRRVPAGTYDEKIKKKKFFVKGQAAPEGTSWCIFRLTSRRGTLIRRQASPPVRDPGSPGSVTSRSVPPPCLASPAFIEIHRTVL